MNWLDYVIIIFFVLSVLAGLANGLVSGLFELARLIVSIAVAAVTFPMVATLLRLIGFPAAFSFFFGFLFSMIVVQIILAVVGRPWAKKLKRMLKDSGLRPLDRLLGPVPQVIMVAISLSFFLALFVSFPIYSPIKTAIIESRYGKQLAQPALSALTAVSDQVKQDVTSYSI